MSTPSEIDPVNFVTCDGCTKSADRIAELEQQLAAVTAERDAVKIIWSVDSITAKLTAALAEAARLAERAEQT